MGAIMAVVEDPRRTRILDSAMKLVLAYGYSRITMEDVAKAAEMSRPALYLLFKNKTDIYRAIASKFMESAVAIAAEELGRQGDFTARMMTAIDRGMIDGMCRLTTSPHGAEIMDMKNSIAGDIAAKWRECMAWHLCGAIDNQATENGVDLAARGLSSHLLADVLLDGLEGMKTRGRDAAACQEMALGLVSLVERAIAR